MAVLTLPDEERTFERLLAACSTHLGVLPNLSEHDRTAALVTEVCLRTGHGLKYLAEDRRSYKLCLQACQTHGRALEYVPSCHKDERLCRLALSNCGLAYRWLPEQLAWRREWQLRACQQNGSVLQWIPRRLHNKALLEAACRSHWMALKFIEPARITYEMCRLACHHNAFEASQHIPHHLMDDKLCWLICLDSLSCRTCERFKPDDSVHFYERLLQENSWASLEWVPKACRTPAHYLRACQKKGTDLQFVPEPYRTPEVCLAACRNNNLALQWVPERQATAQLDPMAAQQPGQTGQLLAKEEIGLEWFVEQIHNDDDRAYTLLLHAKRLLPAADFQSLLERSLLCNGRAKVSMLTHPQVSGAQKKQLIEWMLKPDCWPTPEPPQEADLCERASPLQFTLKNPELIHLSLAAVKVADHWLPPRYGAGQRLLGELERALCSVCVERPDDSEPLFLSAGTPTGGRTLKVAQGAQAFYYKFQRKGESLHTLMQEGVIHRLRERQPDLFGALRSKLPGDSRFFKLYLDSLPEALPQFDDLPEICRDEDGRCYVHVYRYVAPADYSVYAHLADHSHSDNPYRNGELGILTACHDIGQFVAMGLVPTSTLPAFHDSRHKRAWVALHALLGYTEQTAYPGTFGAWNSVATEYCDFGYGGFRDVGDFEVFGKIDSFVHKFATPKSDQIPEVEQCLCLVNAICENLLAANLIRARLRQTGSAYHYQNPEALQQTKTFIEQTLICFLKGMYGYRMQSDSDRCFLRERLQLDKLTYDRWLSRTAVEMLYWTAMQPSADQPDTAPFADHSPLYSHEDGYALHLNRAGRLDPDLYPDNEIKKGHLPTYPDQFQNDAGRLNLGSHNAVFPLTTLMRGLVRLCTGLLTYDHNAVYPPGDL